MRLAPALLLAALLPNDHLSAQAAGSGSPLAPGGGVSAGQPRPGELVDKPGGGQFLQDPQRGGRGGELGLAEVRWGRLVDVHALTSGGVPDLEPVFRDFLIDPNLVSDGVDYELFESAATGVTRLVVRRARGSLEFRERLASAARGTVELAPRALVAPVLALVPRNAALSLRFDDVLDDSPAATLDLANRVRVQAGPDALLPHSARVRFDANHGGVVGGAFHSTRVLVDLALSEFEARALAVPQPLTPSGVPAGDGDSTVASLALRLPTRPDPGSGQFEVLRNLAGRPLDQDGNGPLDASVPTRDLVRGARAGDDGDPSRGFLFDGAAPVPMGVFPLNVTAAVPDPAGQPGFAFLVDWSFTSPCFARPLAGDAVEVGERVLEVVANGPAIHAGSVSGVRVRLAGADAATGADLLGAGVELARYRASALPSACWVRAVPAPLTLPATGLSPAAQFLVRFSEPMEPSSLDPYATLTLVEGTSLPPTPHTLVPAGIAGAGSLHSFTLTPLLPLAHTRGNAEGYTLDLTSGPNEFVTDLAGNALATELAAVFTLDPTAPDEASGGIVLSFSDLDQLGALGKPDLRGTFLIDLERGELRGRPPLFFSATVERTNPVTSLQIPLSLGVQTPLNPLGAKLQSLWRYADLGWGVRDESKYDVDVVGVAWSPFGGSAISDFFPEFELRLAHARKLPDESLDQFLLPRWPSSGLPGSSTPFADNPLGPQVTVHPRSAGYAVQPARIFETPAGTPMLPYPLNEDGGTLASFTWRDTALELEGGANGSGIPLDIEEGPPLFLEPTRGTLAAAGEVPSFGLALLMEFRCWPSDTGLGLNALDSNLAINSSAQPAFRAFSAGGFNTSGQPVTVDPELEAAPRGGFNPRSIPPGRRTLPNDNVLSLGQLDLVYRVSRAHTVWIDTGALAPDFAVLQTLPTHHAPGTDIVVELRGATGFSAGAVSDDARAIDAYGALTAGDVSFLGGSPAWHGDIDALDGARFVQLRLTFVNDIDDGEQAALDAVALSFRE